MKAKYKFYGLDYLTMAKDDRPCYCHFEVKDAETGETLLDFYTNRYLEGRFVYDERTCGYRQTRGTCQYGLYGITPQAARARLRKEIESED